MNSSTMSRVLPVVFLSAVATVLGQPAASDVEVRLVPSIGAPLSNALHRNDSHFTGSFNPFNGRYELALNDWPAQNTFALEVWVSDVGTVNSGLVSAYFDVLWSSGAAADVTRLRHSGLFSDLLEGLTQNELNRILNFGGTDSTLIGRGLQPDFALVGWAELLANEIGVIDFDAMIGLGELGVVGRGIGDVAFSGARVIVPEPASLTLLAVGTFVLLRRRR